MKFSVIVVSLNAGEKLIETVNSILDQSFTDFEIVVKDGGSTDGSLDALPKDERIRLFREPDKGIYEAMNQATAHASGEYILFLNCGDLFYDEKVLERTAGRIRSEREKMTHTSEKQAVPLIFYGDTFSAKNGVLIASPQKIDGFACFRNIPCHQSCFYEACLCKTMPYNTEYRIRADYDHFLRCVYEAGAKTVYLGEAVSSYEGGGYSEKPENRRRDRQEHREITEKYIPRGELLLYRFLMATSLAPLRSLLAENRWTSGIYHWIKDRLYHHKLRVAVGAAVFLIEAALLLLGGFMREELTHYHTGEGAVAAQFDTDAEAVACQRFRPQHARLSEISFLMDMEGTDAESGSVNVRILDPKDRIVYEEDLPYSRIADGYFTDLRTNLRVRPGQDYRLLIGIAPDDKGEYARLMLCAGAYFLPENGTLSVGDKEVEDQQFVGRYRYTDVLPAARARHILIVCLATALGILFGLPDNRKIRKAAAAVLFLTVPYVLGSRLEMLNFREMYYLPMALKWNVGIMYGLQFAALLLTHSLAGAVLIANTAMTLLYSVNFFVLQYRGTPLRVNDLSAAGTALDVAGNFRFVPSAQLAMEWALFVMFIVWTLQTITRRTQEEKALRRKRRGLVLAGYCLSGSLAVGILACGFYKFTYTDYFDDIGFADKDYRGINQDLIYQADGYLVATCIEVKKSRIRPPEGYSVEKVEEILKRAKETAEDLSPAEAGKLPHVIVIMNESLADLDVLGKLETNTDCLPFMHSLKEDTVSGYVNVSVLGGGTANSEFEMLTGCSMAFFSSDFYPYQQGVKRDINSFVSRMKQCGYTTYSMHPEKASNWKRGEVYKHYGFDVSLWKGDFKDAERIHSGVSDAETYNKIIGLWEAREPGEKMFVFDLTIQNHADYLRDESPYAVRALNFDNQAIDEYLSLMKISDDAFADLVNYFRKQDEKVLICMFGDHQPWISSQILPTDSETPPLTYMKKFKTPFVIWANYDIEEAQGYDISANYLGGLIQETAGVPLSPFFEYLRKLRGEYPIITVKGYVDSEGEYRNWESDKTEFSDYRMLQYHLLFGKDYRKWGY